MVKNRGIFRPVIGRTDSPRLYAAPSLKDIDKRMMNESALAGMGVLITRPREQNATLARLIEKHGGRPFAVTAYNISATQDVHGLANIAKNMNSYDFIFFISAAAVTWGTTLLALNGNTGSPQMLWGAVGASTAQAMREAGLPVNIVPANGYDSENLLRMPQLEAVTNKNVLIVRGDGGRELLAQTLRQRGANVVYAQVYRRECPKESLSSALSPQDRAQIDAAVVTSNEGLRNIHTMAGAQLHSWLCELKLVVMSERAVAFARELGFKQPPRVVPRAGNDGILDALIELKTNT